MKKLSFLELEKEMEVMTEEENFRTKAGGNPPYSSKNCFFLSLGYILDNKWDMNVNEQSIENSFNVYKDPNPYDNYVPDTVNKEGIYPSDINGWADNYMDSMTYNGGSMEITSGASGLPNTTLYPDTDQYMLVIDGRGDLNHAVVFKGRDGAGGILYYDPQTSEHGKTTLNKGNGTVHVHRNLSIFST